MAISNQHKMLHDTPASVQANFLRMITSFYIGSGQEVKTTF